MKKTDLYYLFHIDDGFYLYDYSVCSVVEIPDVLYDSLMRYKKEEKNSSDEKVIIEEFKSQGFLSTSSDFFDNDMTNKIAYLSFAPTYNCNFRCTYCFGKYGNTYSGTPKSFDKDMLSKMLDYFFYKAFPEAEQYRVDFVSGGEPLLGFDIIKDTVEYIERFSTETGKQVSVWLCTNASLMTDEIIEYISSHNISIGISIDGSREKNDMNRVDISGNGTYESICNGIRLIMNNDNISKKTKNIWGLCTATNDNCDFVEILNHMKLLGFQNVQIRLIRSSSHYDISEIIRQYDKLAQCLLEEFEEGNLDRLKMILNDNDQFGKVLKRILLNDLLVRRCNAGVNKITICPDGTIYPCDSLVGVQEAVLGNMRGIEWNRDLYKGRTLNTINECNKCDAMLLCGGDCFYNSYMKRGTQTLPDKEYCIIQKHIINRALVLRYEMEILNEARCNSLIKEIKIRNDYSELFG